MFLKLLQRYLKVGRLTLVEPNGTRHEFGTGQGAAGRHATWVIRSPDCMRRILRNPLLNIGETYMDEAWDVEDAPLADLIWLLRRNVEPEVAPRGWRYRVVNLLRTWNSLGASRQNVSHHYDLDEQLFRAFLDDEMHYSCAYFRDPDMSLEEAQLAKATHVARKLLLQPGQRVLDIGSGWGAMAMHLAAQADVEVVGLTLSEEQLRVSRAEAKRRGLADRVTFQLEDYRQHRGDYDRIVSIGMFEHVGRRNYLRYFDLLKRALKPTGVALLHTIGTRRISGPVNPWILRYIFPGGYLPSLSDVAPGIERAGLTLTDLEVLRYHYGYTLREWHRRFQQHRARFAAEKGERFCRMWEFYLSASQASFELGDTENFQIQLANSQADVPISRDYLYASGRNDLYLNGVARSASGQGRRGRLL
jgi:cyclopropane-fatty-acyl-phospholipid synthase